MLVSTNSEHISSLQERLWQILVSTNSEQRSSLQERLWQILVSTNSEQRSSLQERLWQILVSTNSEHRSSVTNVGINQLGAQIKSTGKTVANVGVNQLGAQIKSTGKTVANVGVNQLGAEIKSTGKTVANVGVNQLGAEIKSTRKTVANIGINQLGALNKSTGKNDSYWYQPTRSTDQVYRKEWQLLVSTNSEHRSNLQERMTDIVINQLGAQIQSTGKNDRYWYQPTQSTDQVYRKEWHILVSTNSEHRSNLQEKMTDDVNNQLGAQIKSKGKNDRCWYQPTCLQERM